MTRRRLPDRRRNATVDLVVGGTVYGVTLGFHRDGTLAEVFAHGAKVGSGMDLLCDDICVALSLLLQHGVSPADLAHSMGRLARGEAASIVGALVDLLAREVGP